MSSTNVVQESNSVSVMSITSATRYQGRATMSQNPQYWKWTVLLPGDAEACISSTQHSYSLRPYSTWLPDFFDFHFFPGMTSHVGTPYQTASSIYLHHAQRIYGYFHPQGRAIKTRLTSTTNRQLNLKTCFEMYKVQELNAKTAMDGQEGCLIWRLHENREMGRKKLST